MQWKLMTEKCEKCICIWAKFAILPLGRPGGQNIQEKRRRGGHIEGVRPSLHGEGYPLAAGLQP